MDEYGVELVVNPDYAAKNNLHSLRLVKEHLENAYIVPCDIWCDRNPFTVMSCTHGIWSAILWKTKVMSV